MEYIQKLKQILEEVEHESERFYNKGVKVSSTRAREALTELKNVATDARKDILETRKSRELKG